MEVSLSLDSQSLLGAGPHQSFVADGFKNLMASMVRTYPHTHACAHMYT